jgi:hypothetical protein
MAATAAPTLPAAAIGAEVIDRVDADVRYRLEWVDQARFDEEAIASTLRTRLGIESAKWHGVHGYVGFEDVRSLGHDGYNSTANGRADLPVVADPEDTELDQAWIGFTHATVQARIGRQKVNLDNQRFVGAVGFRQNQQTFDGATVTVAAFGGRLFTGYLTNANRVFGDHHPDAARADLELRAYLVNYSRAFGPLKAAAYGYFLKLPNTPAASHRDLGLRLSGEPKLTADWQLPFAFEYARQSPWSDAPATVSANYFLVEAGARWRDTTGKLGYEVLGGNGTHAFATPLATLHAFNGWADRFLVTPAAGLRDAYVQVAQNFGPAEASIIYHDFRSDAGSQRYATEWDAMLGSKIGSHLSARVEYANYRARDFGAGTRIVWFTLQADL